MTSQFSAVNPKNAIGWNILVKKETFAVKGGAELPRWFISWNFSDRAVGKLSLLNRKVLKEWRDPEEGKEDRPLLLQLCALSLLCDRASYLPRAHPDPGTLLSLWAHTAIHLQLLSVTKLLLWLSMHVCGVSVFVCLRTLPAQLFWPGHTDSCINSNSWLMNCRTTDPLFSWVCTCATLRGRVC